MSHLRDQNSGKAWGTDGEQDFSVDLLLLIQADSFKISLSRQMMLCTGCVPSTVLGTAQRVGKRTSNSAFMELTL